MSEPFDPAARLLPRPHRLDLRPGIYSIFPAAGLRLKGYPGDPGPLFALFSPAGLDARFEAEPASGPHPVLTLDRPGDGRRGQAEQDLAALLATIPDPAIRAQAYALTVTPSGAVAAAGGPAGLFHAAVTLSKLITADGTVPCLSILDRPALAARAVLLDVSRGRVPTLAALQSLVDLLADLKFNQLTFNIEHTFACPAHPAIGAGHDPLTAAELGALTAFAAARHVELIPFQQSFGHLRGILSLPEYQRLAYDRRYHWSLDPANDDIYRLLADLYDAQLAAVPSRYLHVGCDEPFDLVKYYDPARFAGRTRARVIRDHLTQLHGLVTARGRTMMIWADTIVAHPEILADLPRDIVLCHWDYGTGALEGPERYRPALELMADSGHPFYACTCTWSMMKIFPDLAVMRANHQSMVPLAKKNGAAGHMVTIWGDLGHMNLLGLETYPLAYAAKHAWEDDPIFDESFGPAYSWTVFNDLTNTAGKIAEELDQGNQLLKAPAGLAGIGFLLFFDEPMNSGLMALIQNHGEIADKLLDLFLESWKLLKSPESWEVKTGIKTRREFWQDYRLPYQQLRVIYYKMVAWNFSHLRWPGQPQAVAGDDCLTSMESILGPMAGSIRGSLPLLEERWLANAKPSDLELNRERYRRLIQAAEYRVAQIKSYWQDWGKMPKLQGFLSDPGVTYKFNPLEEMGLVGLL